MAAADCEAEPWRAALEAGPGDRLVRLAFADWLEERGVSGAAGWRALGVYGRVPAALVYYGPRLGWRRRNLQERVADGVNRAVFRADPGLLPWPWYVGVVRVTGGNWFHTRWDAEWAAADGWVAMGDGDRETCDRVFSQAGELA